MTPLLKQTLGKSLSIFAAAAGAMLVVHHFSGQHRHSLDAYDPQKATSLVLHQFPEGKTTIPELGSKLVLINFWATWCAPCRIELPSLVELQKTFPETDLRIVLLSVDASADVKLPPFLKQTNIPFPVYLDREQHWSDFFDVHGIPITAILDKNGKTLYVEEGARDWNSTEVQDRIRQWLAER
jgi:thiol-disulfide isomerase/thioredoxin